MKQEKQYQFIYGAIFLLANKLQLLGDRNQTAVSTKQYFLLVTLQQFRRHIPSLSELAEFMACTRQNVKKLALALAEKGMLVLLPDEMDQRVLRVHLTAEGDDYVSQRTIQEQVFYEQLFQNLSDVQISYLETGLLKMAENMAKLEFPKEEETVK